MTKSITIQGIEFTYKGKQKVFHDFSLLLEQQEEKGKIIGIMGSSGSGKSTLMKLLLGIEKVQRGFLKVMPEKPVIAYVPQEPVLFEHLSITDNATYFQFAGAHKKRFNVQLYNSLTESLGLKEVLAGGRSVTELSGGQRQRLSLLRALSIEPDLLLLDEPCNGLDAAVKKAFLNKLREVTEQYGLFVLYITHHKLEAQLVADEVVYLVQDKTTSVVQHAAHAAIEDFIRKPPVMEAVQVFRFPDLKLLPVNSTDDANVVIALNEYDITQYWVVEDENIKVNDKYGFPFKLVSRSPIYAVIRHMEAKIDWMLASNLLKDYSINDTVYIEISGTLNIYDSKGFSI